MQEQKYKEELQTQLNYKISFPLWLRITKQAMVKIKNKKIFGGIPVLKLLYC